MTKSREKELEQQVADLRTQLLAEQSRAMTQEYLLLKRLYPYMANELDFFRSQATRETDAPLATPNAEKDTG